MHNHYILKKDPAMKSWHIVKVWSPLFEHIKGHKSYTGNKKSHKSAKCERKNFHHIFLLFFFALVKSFFLVVLVIFKFVIPLILKFLKSGF